MLEEQVDPVGTQPLQGSLDGPGDVLGPAVQTGAGGAVVAEAELGGQHHLVPRCRLCMFCLSWRRARGGCFVGWSAADEPGGSQPGLDVVAVLADLFAPDGQAVD